MSDFKVEIRGFKSQEEADEFIEWFSDQGEQDLSCWFEEASRDNPAIRPFLLVECNKTFPIKHTDKTSILELD